MFAVKPDLVAYVRLTEGGTVKLHAGDTVPAEADENHVAELVERGVITEVEEPSGGSSRRGRSGDQS